VRAKASLRRGAKIALARPRFFRYRLSKIPVLTTLAPMNTSTAPLPCPFCGKEPGNLLMVKIYCANDDCAIFDIPVDIGKWNRREAPAGDKEGDLKQ
jgi:hypothetical protein